MYSPLEDERLLKYMAPMDTEMSDEIEMMVKDNLEWWWISNGPGPRKRV